MKNRFRAEEISELIYRKYFSGSKMKGIRDPDFLEAITPSFICLVCTCIQHALKAYKTGEFIAPPDFKTTNNIRKSYPVPNKYLLT